MKKSIIPVALCALMLSSCGKAKEDSLVKKAVLAEFSERNVSVGMSMDEVRAAESLALEEDANDAVINENHSARYLTSTDLVPYDGKSAIITYCFTDDKLCGISYDFDVSYNKDNYKDNGVLAIYKEYKLNFTELYGNPIQTDDVDFYPVDPIAFCNSVWGDAELNDAIIGLDTAVPSLDSIIMSDADITDTISISYFVNE